MQLQIRWIYLISWFAATAPNHIRSEWAAAAGSSDRPHIGHGHTVKTGLQINMLGVLSGLKSVVGEPLFKVIKDYKQRD